MSSFKDSPPVSFIKNILGEGVFDDLRKFEVIDYTTETAIDHEEVRTALQLVPRALLSFLQAEIGTLPAGGVKEVRLPIKRNAYLNVNKKSTQSYNGEIREGGKILIQFNNRTLPGIALIVMTTFELYDAEAVKESSEMSDDVAIKIQKIIDEKLALRDTIEKVVEKKISEREAIESMIKVKLAQMLSDGPKTEESVKKKTEMKKLKSFLQKRKSSLPSLDVALGKSEKIHCPDCKGVLLSDKGFTGCVCLGEDRTNKLRLIKTESGVKVSFPKSWDFDNIQMLLRVLRKSNGSK